MIRIFRLEAKNGKGMYRNGEISFYDILGFAGLRKSDHRCHISPNDDCQLGWSDEYDSSDWFFGFANLIQYNRWTVSKRIRALLDVYEFVLQTYECPSLYVKRSDHQVIFIKDKATLVDTSDPTEFDDFCEYDY